MWASETDLMALRCVAIRRFGRRQIHQARCGPRRVYAIHVADYAIRSKAADDSTPLTLCLVVMGQHVEQLEFLQVAFGDRPALLKSESFYQRLLAEDEDDLQEQAEKMLKETSLASYYDDVAMPGLELAARDMARRVLARSQVEKLRAA
jgi:hypothetical protein